GEAYLPEGLAVTRWGGPMQQVEQFSSETAVASIGYGAGELAAGYKVEGRIHADAAGKKPEPAKAAGRTGSPGWFGDRTEKGAGPATKAAAMASPPSGKPGRTPEEKAKVAGTKMGKAEGKGKEGGGPDDYAATLAKNYWRTGQEYYQQGNYESAEKALRKVTELSSGSQYATNAGRLLSNLDVVRGQAKLSGAQEKAAGKGVQQEAAQQRQDLSRQQYEVLAKGFEALKAGDRSSAQYQFQAAQGYNAKLLEQGETAKEQDALLAEARKEMQATAAAEQTKARELIDQAKKLEPSPTPASPATPSRLANWSSSSRSPPPGTPRPSRTLAWQASRAASPKTVATPASRPTRAAGAASRGSIRTRSIPTPLRRVPRKAGGSRR
ncbi:MAG: hypothetical protein NT031_10470, partial [Planctomycetota bacterium]|nr:hypothetical protein [Planctomycetota bacterium]